MRENFIPFPDIEGRTSLRNHNVLRHIVRRVFDAEGDKNGDIRERFLHIVVVGVRHGKRQNILRFKREMRVFGKGFFNLPDSAGKIVRMVHVDIQNDGNRRIKTEKRILIFACFKNKVVAAADGICPAHLIGLRTGEHSRAPARGKKHVRHHRVWRWICRAYRKCRCGAYNPS